MPQVRCTPETCRADSIQSHAAERLQEERAHHAATAAKLTELQQLVRSDADERDGYIRQLAEALGVTGTGDVRWQDLLAAADRLRCGDAPKDDVTALERVRLELRWREADAATKEAELYAMASKVAGYELDDWDEAMEYVGDAVKAHGELRAVVAELPSMGMWDATPSQLAQAVARELREAKE